MIENIKVLSLDELSVDEAIKEIKALITEENIKEYGITVKDTGNETIDVDFSEDRIGIGAKPGKGNYFMTFEDNGWYVIAEHSNRIIAGEILCEERETDAGVDYQIEYGDKGRGGDEAEKALVKALKEAIEKEFNDDIEVVLTAITGI